MSLANRFLYVNGRELSEDGRVGAFGSPSKNPKVQDKTGPFQTRATKAQTGFVEWGDLTFTLWADADLSSFVSSLRGADTTMDELLVVWGDDTDALASGVYMGNLLLLSTQPKTEPAALNELAITATPDQYGFMEGRSLGALAAHAADGDSEATSLNNGVIGSAITIATSSIANPSVITTSTPHGFLTGDTVIIAGHGASTPSINASHVVTVTSTTAFTIPINVTTGSTAGTATRTSTRGGGYVDLHVSANAPDTATGLSVMLRHSPDNATFATKGTFTTITTVVSAADPAAGYSQRLIVTGSIDRYAALSWDFTGTAGTATATFTGFIRRVNS